MAVNAIKPVRCAIYTEASTNVSAIFLLFRFGIRSYDAHLETVFDAASIGT
jgi:hypothetical protein